MSMLVTGASEGKLAFNYVGVTRGRSRLTTKPEN